MIWFKLGFLAIVIAAITFGVHSYNEGLRQDGRDEKQAEWDAAKAAQKEREAKAAKEADDFALRLDAKRTADYAALARRNKALESKLATEQLSGALAGSMRDAIRTSNGQSPGDTPQDSSPTTGLAVKQWTERATEQYRACREQVMGWVKWDDERVAP